MSIIWSGKTASYHHKWNETPNDSDEPKGFSKVYMLNAQWTDCPQEVVEEVNAAWRGRSLGNDNYIIRTDLDQLEEEYAEYKNSVDSEDKYGYNWEATIQYIKEQAPDISPEERIFIYYWW